MADAEPRDIATLPPEMTILADHPARAEASSPDLLGLESRLSAVFDILRHKNTSCPITIAVYGDWGTGKTSAMRWLETKLSHWNMQSKADRKEHPRVHPVWFDPWRYHTREEVWRGIIAEVILALFHVEGISDGKLAKGLRSAAKRFGAFLGRGFLHALAHTEVKFGSKAKADVGVAEAGMDTEVKFSGEMFQDIYEEFQQELPQPGTRVVTTKGQGRVLAQEVLARKVLVEFEDGRRLPVPVADVLTRLGR